MSEFDKLQTELGLTFNNIDLYRKAFTHKSYINENTELQEDNERLEFLGDAVLELIVTEALFTRYPDKPEGDLTAFRSALVRGRHLAFLAKEINLGDYLLLSKGEEKSGGREKDYILANTFEAFIGAMYLDCGYQTAENFIHKHVLTNLEDIVTQGLHVDPKTSFQEIAQEKENTTPEYRLISDAGPDHDKTFLMGVFLGEEQIAVGEGTSKQKAELKAAEKALEVKGWLR